MTGILIANKILGYFRFVDDVLIIYNYTITHKLGSQCTYSRTSKFQFHN